MLDPSLSSGQASPREAFPQPARSFESSDSDFGDRLEVGARRGAG